MPSADPPTRTLVPLVRPRLLPAAVCAATIAAGLAARAVLDGGPAKYSGVAIWATL